MKNKMDDNIVCYIVLVAGMLSIISLPLRGIYIEKKFFNIGICPCCGNPLRDWAINCKGERGYLCEICGYHTWVSYKTVDKKYRRNGGTVR